MIAYNRVYFPVGFGSEYKSEAEFVKAYSGKWERLTDEHLKEVYKLLNPKKEK